MLRSALGQFYIISTIKSLDYLSCLLYYSTYDEMQVVGTRRIPRVGKAGDKSTCIHQLDCTRSWDYVRK